MRRIPGAFSGSRVGRVVGRGTPSSPSTNTGPPAARRRLGWAGHQPPRNIPAARWHRELSANWVWKTSATLRITTRALRG